MFGPWGPQILPGFSEDKSNLQFISGFGSPNGPQRVHRDLCLQFPLRVPANKQKPKITCHVEDSCFLRFSHSRLLA